ncbi:MAG: protein translocase component YidC [Chloroflexi bacterium HGW-Chloroflexi-1]|nr:MAG: protein translocase component YidC [Chloroflexi bacterium HGW-Chloroflexi-1]
MNKKLRTLLLIAVLLLVAISLSGCGVPRGEIDLNAPPGWWEALIVYPLAKLLMFLNRTISGIGIPYSYGWAIIVLTIALKIVTLPLTLKQLQSTKAQQALQPQLKELQDKYGKDKQKLSEAQMKLYKEAGFNPLGGCLPLLIQLPVLWGLYQSLYVLANPSMGELQGAGFFWIPDLSYPSLEVGTKWISESFQTQNWGKLIAYFSLPLIMIISQLVLQKMTQPPKSPKTGQRDSQQQMMGQMMMFMPIMFGYITLGLPSGLTLYWSISNVLSVVQQYFVTGWGGLTDWLPMLKAKTVEVVLIR